MAAPSDLRRRSRPFSTVYVLTTLCACGVSPAVPTAGVIAYCRQPAQGTHGLSKLYGIDPDGTHDALLVEAPIGLNHHEWSPDGSRLAVTGYIGADTWSIHVVDADGSGLTRLTTTAWVWDAEVSWSPDSTLLAFSRIYPSEGRRTELWVMGADGSGQHGLGVDGFQPRWSHDGAHLLYSSQKSGNWELYSSDADGANEGALTTSPANEQHASWSPDGHRIAYVSDASGITELYTMAADGGSPVQLTHDGASVATPKWSPDGTRIVFASDVSGAFEVYVIDSDGSNEARVTHSGSATAVNPTWRPGTE